MKVTVKLPVPLNATIVVDIGDKVTQNSHYAVLTSKNSEKIIHLARLLKIPPQDIQKYLVVRVGEEIHEGEIIAQRKSFLKTFFIRSPLDGKIKEIDFKKGIAVIDSSKEDEESGKIKTQVAGKIVKINSNDLELELEGIVLEVLDGGGTDVIGEVINFDKSVDTLDLSSETMDKIVLCTDITESALMKAEMIKVKGLILNRPSLPTVLPWVNVDREVFEKIRRNTDKKAWLRIALKQLVILE